MAGSLNNAPLPIHLLPLPLPLTLPPSSIAPVSLVPPISLPTPSAIPESTPIHIHHPSIPGSLAHLSICQVPYLAIPCTYLCLPFPPSSPLAASLLLLLLLLLLLFFFFLRGCKPFAFSLILLLLFPFYFSLLPLLSALPRVLFPLRFYGYGAGESRFRCSSTSLFALEPQFFFNPFQLRSFTLILSCNFPPSSSHPRPRHPLTATARRPAHGSSNAWPPTPHVFSSSTSFLFLFLELLIPPLLGGFATLLSLAASAPS
ncbi:hypothetical protein B0I35DRAFT_270645 [Stachybotrys elegans]|uniref:Uncharacterized protein n=1 Tax=Stachybotrys elegans TaxID=80388 RepID=A0A8K0WPI3_9HYPO|nr:hypothetical protein B0I35DRAFT_270645 [Stachybotrys elegans]